MPRPPHVEGAISVYLTAAVPPGAATILGRTPRPSCLAGCSGHARHFQPAPRTAVLRSPAILPPSRSAEARTPGRHARRLSRRAANPPPARGASSSRRHAQSRPVDKVSDAAPARHVSPHHTTARHGLPGLGRRRVQSRRAVRITLNSSARLLVPSAADAQYRCLIGSGPSTLLEYAPPGYALFEARCFIGLASSEQQPWPVRPTLHTAAPHRPCSAPPM